MAQATAIDYDHRVNTHTTTGARTALPVLLGSQRPTSILDVGCGTGTWLSAALDLGISDVFGVDGVDIPASSLLIPRELFAKHDLSKPLRLGRRFDLVFCFEIAEHLEQKAAKVLLNSLTEHSDTILFSAARPGQGGQHHINCQWPSYWQDLFNDCGFVCADDVRWKLWTDTRIEYWYRQNMFSARKDKLAAGREPRIAPVIHPECMPGDPRTEAFSCAVNEIRNGYMPVPWYVGSMYSAIQSKLRRRLRAARLRKKFGSSYTEGL